MTSEILKSNRPFVIILAILSGFALWFLTIVYPPVLDFKMDSSSMPLYKLALGFFKGNMIILNVFAFLLIIIQSLLIVRLNQKYILINARTFLPAFFYILISSSLVDIQEINPVLLGNFFIFFALDLIFKIYRSDYALSEIYLAGFFIAIASLIWAPFAIFQLLIWASLIIMRPFIGREWIVSILGFLTPVLFAFVMYYVFLDNVALYAILYNIKNEFMIVPNFKSISLSSILFYSFLLFIILIASYNIIRNYQNRKIKTRKYFVINLFYFLIGLSIFLFFKRVSYEIIYILSIPVSFLLTDYFYSTKKNFFLNIILLLLYAGLVYMQIAHLN